MIIFLLILIILQATLDRLMLQCHDRDSMITLLNLRMRHGDQDEHPHHSTHPGTMRQTQQDLEVKNDFSLNFSTVFTSSTQRNQI